MKEKTPSLEDMQIDTPPEVDQCYAQFREVFKRFEFACRESPQEAPTSFEIYESDGEDFEPEETPIPTLSKKALRKLKCPSVGYLKLLILNPELVTEHETRAADPFLTLHLKGYRHFIPVPSHWVKPYE